MGNGTRSVSHIVRVKWQDSGPINFMHGLCGTPAQNSIMKFEHGVGERQRKAGVKKFTCFFVWREEPVGNSVKHEAEKKANNTTP